MLTLKVKNMRDGEIIADNYEDAMYKLAKENKETSKKPKGSLKNFLEYVKKNSTKVERYIPTPREERNARYIFLRYKYFSLFCD